MATLFTFSTGICFMVLLQRSYVSATSTTINQESNPIPASPTAEGFCRSVLCISSYAKYYNEILLENPNYEYGCWNFVVYSYATKYFRLWEPTPISSIIAAFQTCISLNKHTGEECTQFLNVFYSKNYTIDLIAKVCKDNHEVCEDPVNRLLPYQDTLRVNDDILDFQKCLSDVTNENDPIVIYNFRFVKLLQMKKRTNTNIRNRCSCHQVHGLGTVYRLLKYTFDITENSAPAEFDDLLTSLCITTNITDTPLSWTSTSLRRLGSEAFNLQKRGVFDHYLLAKAIIMHYKYITPTYREHEKGWTTKDILEMVHDLSGSLTDYARAMNLVAQGISIFQHKDHFQRFMKITSDIHERQSDIPARSDPPLKSQLLTLRELIMNAYISNSSMLTEVPNEYTQQSELSLNSILEFFMYNYMSH